MDNEIELKDAVKEDILINYVGKNYAHFDFKIFKKGVRRNITNVMNEKWISTHSFYPFVYQELEIKKFKKNIDGSKELKTKNRQILSSSHIDSLIYTYYNKILYFHYEKYIELKGLKNSIIAYRKITGTYYSHNAMKNKEYNKCNIHFAKDAFDFIQSCENALIFVGDFKGFYDNIDHENLKKRMCEVLGVDFLSDDWYKIYQSITKYTAWIIPSDFKKHNNNILMSKEYFKENKKDNIKKFKKGWIEIEKNELSKIDFNDGCRAEQIMNLWKRFEMFTNKTGFGIPQGSPISALLSNIYMIDFDSKVKKYVEKHNGTYMRYSDDFLIVLPTHIGNEKKTENNISDFISRLLSNDDGLFMEKNKNELYIYNASRRSISDVNNIQREKKLTYLGFTFDGENISLKDATITRYYGKLYRKIDNISKHKKKNAPKNAQWVLKKSGSSVEKRIPLTSLYLRYSFFGAKKTKENRFGNFITYAKKCEDIFGHTENVSHINKRHLKKINKRLNK